ncbi:hypothetical protein Si103_01195 [Streptococcus infantarius subsp. infantarius]|uniref:Bacteriocin n=1 Tax=Streptococcus macedonicus TaxID=59310 RepID=A0A1C3SST2_STRMC|nr:hypothetical protein [Streptococcus macedonicus]MCO4520996.1 hypothetical protein [Streptococcus infantarius subsp. infantarius]CCF03197.1 Hypothetical protein SMA_1906 [Streptococcus macedonicus ACA-DC 198]MBF6977056.1 bacteriocin [Streptococcus macedonicus]MCO4530863.1 hypothetical protein [Streptococcus infantarius subsp. infantarius]MCO4533515.1 hypothetical protein [Streptococcus infantarius subsp. infantarius]
MIKTLFSQYKTAVLVIDIILLLTVYPQIFKIIYMSGRDFGRSLVNALLP